MVDDKRVKAAIEMLAAMSNDDLVAAVCTVLAQRAVVHFDDAGGVKYFEGFGLAEITYSASDDIYVQWLAFDQARTRRAGFDEQGRCSVCGCLVCSEVKLPNCPVCTTPVECT